MSNTFDPKQLKLRATKIGASIFDDETQVAFIANVPHRKEIADLLAASSKLYAALENLSRVVTLSPNAFCVENIAAEIALAEARGESQ